MRTDTVQVPFLDLAAQNGALRSEIDAALSAVIDRNAFILGPAVASFEALFASYCETDHAIGVSSGTAALQFIMQASGIGPGDEVITVPNTFIATVEAIAGIGAKPVLVDVDAKTWLIDPGAVEERITEKTAAILAVDLYGSPVDMDALRSIATRRGIVLLEDACQAHGARYNGSRVGRGSLAAGFSFYPGKNLGAFGDAGAVVTSDPEIASKVRAFGHHGQREKNIHELLGTTGRLDSLQAAVLEVKLPHLDEWNARRRAHAALYRERLAGSRYEIPETVTGAEPVYHLFVVNHPEVEKAKSALSENGIGWGEHYPRAVHLHPAFRHLGREGEFPVAEKVCDRILSLPMYPEMEPGMVERVCEVLLSIDA